jgi:acyl carrier protein
MTAVPGVIAAIQSLIVDRLELELEPAALDPQLDLVDQIGLDSSATVDVMYGLEDHFDLEITPEDVTEDHFRSIASMAEYIAGRL